LAENGKLGNHPNAKVIPTKGWRANLRKFNRPKEKPMNKRCQMNKVWQVAGNFIIILMVLALAGCAAPTPTALRMLKPGDSVGGMIVQKGASKPDVPPIWAFCSPDSGNKPGVVTEDCTVPALPELGIGHGWITYDEANRESDWKAFTWELYLDGQAIDLNAFGIFDADLPQTGVPGHDPNEEVITKLRAHDVLLTNLKPGDHILRSVMHQSEAVGDELGGTYSPGTYELIVNFTIEAQ
jgi:hypothetical protein